MAYIIQHRRDWADAWNSNNPILAAGEVGFIVDLDENGKQKSSLYKLGDGATAWNDLPLFGYSGNVRNLADAWKGSDQDTTIASQAAVLYKIKELLSPVESDVEALQLNKVEKSQIVQDTEAGDSDSELILSKATTIKEFADIWEAITKNAEADATHIELSSKQIATLNAFAEEYGPRVATSEEKIVAIEGQLDKHTKDIYGWDESVVTGTDPETGEEIVETVHHDSIDEKIAKVGEEVVAVDAKLDSAKEEMKNMHQILTEVEYAQLDKSTYPDGTIFFTYKDE